MIFQTNTRRRYRYNYHSDIRRESDFTEVDLRKIAETYATSNKKNHNYATCAIDSLIDYKIDVLRFAWKTSKTIVLKKKLETVRR
jgi:hypothetical protein